MRIWIKLIKLIKKLLIKTVKRLNKEDNSFMKSVTLQWKRIEKDLLKKLIIYNSSLSYIKEVKLEIRKVFR